MMALSWGPWTPLTDETPWNSKWGIYRVRMVSASGGPVSLPRLTAVDPAGLLYIGRSGDSTAKTDRSLGRRVWEFYSHGSHSGAGTWWQTKRALDAAELWAGRTLAVAVVELPDAEIDEAECRALRAYFDRFAELPPCNSAFPGKWKTFGG